MMTLILFLAFLLGFVTMFFGAITGGVGLITRPVLIFMGFPSSAVVASSRVAGVAGEWPGLYVLHKSKKIDWKIVSFLVIPMTLGSVLASIAVITIMKSNLDLILGLLLLLAGFFLLFKSKIGLAVSSRKFSDIKTKCISFLGTLPISFLSTITGGLGPLYSMLYIWLYGKTFISASALWRLAANISSIFSAAVFIIGGIVDWQLCIALLLGFAFGSFFGTRFGLKKGEKWVRYIVIIVTFAGAAKLLFF
ncbi:MAG: sulfite exporter TauE/SafE family protein [Candidatus Nanoarchaeia archaeon]